MTNKALNDKYNSLKQKAEIIIKDNTEEDRKLKGILNNNWVFITTDNKKPYMVKFIPKNEQTRLEVEVSLYDYLKSNTDIPVPEIIEYKKESDQDYVLREIVEGQSLDEFLKECKNPKKIFCEAGEILAKIHSIQFDKKGLINPDMTVFEYQIFSQEEYLSLIENLYNKQLITEYEYLKLQEINVDDYYNIKPNVLCHCDFAPGNILVRDEKIVGIIDMEWAGACPFMDDVATFDLFVGFKGFSEYIDDFYNGYNSIKTIPNYYFENIEFYKFYRLITMLSFHVDVEDEKFDMEFYNNMRKELSRLLSTKKII